VSKNNQESSASAETLAPQAEATTNSGKLESVLLQIATCGASFVTVVEFLVIIDCQVGQSIVVDRCGLLA
jgi:hypothetical protein